MSPLRHVLQAGAILLIALLAAAATVAVAMPAIATPAARPPTMAIVVRDQTPLRAAPRDSAQQQAVLWAGEVVEVRGERMDYLQVWDHGRERGGFVRASQVHRSALAAADAPELLALVRFVRDNPGGEGLGIGIAAAYLHAAPVEALQGAAGVEAFDALGTLADRLAQRASVVAPAGAVQSKAAEAALAAHLEVARHYGVRFTSFEREGRMQICYDGEAFRRVLAMVSQPMQRARAALALTRPECFDPTLGVRERASLDEWRAGVLDRVDTSLLPAYLRNRVAMRRAGLWSALAYQRTRQGEAGNAAAERALAELAVVDKAELTDDDMGPYNDAAMRVNASRWAATLAGGAGAVAKGSGPTLTTVVGEPGQTCVLVVDAKHDAAQPLVRRCTFGIVWIASTTRSRESNALAVAVQPMAAWRELWVFRKTADGWAASVLPPASSTPEIGVAEFAGWVPGGKQMLVAREARGEGKHRRSFEIVRIDSLATERQASDPVMLGAFQRWQDPAWKRETVSLR
ncbi:MAG: hypothetical protein ABJA61_02035 [Caldimonas sp.]